MTLYHVTHTNKVAAIQAKGLLRFQTSNWAKASGERYGQGEVYAFDNLTDAVRWAGKMDWQFHKAMGSGKIAIVAFAPGEHEWEVDNADPLAQAMAKGRWLKSERPVPADLILGSVPVTSQPIRAVIHGQEPKLDFEEAA
jgi:hypothetical protein